MHTQVALPELFGSQAPTFPGSLQPSESPLPSLEDSDTFVEEEFGLSDVSVQEILAQATTSLHPDPEGKVTVQAAYLHKLIMEINIARGHLAALSSQYGLLLSANMTLSSELNASHHQLIQLRQDHHEMSRQLLTATAQILSMHSKEPEK